MTHVSWLYLLGAWASIMALGVAILGGVWHGGRVMQRIEDDLKDHRRRLETLEAWRNAGGGPSPSRRPPYPRW